MRIKSHELLVIIFSKMNVLTFSSLGINSGRGQGISLVLICENPGWIHAVSLLIALFLVSFMTIFCICYRSNMNMLHKKWLKRDKKWLKKERDAAKRKKKNANKLVLWPKKTVW